MQRPRLYREILSQLKVLISNKLHVQNHLTNWRSHHVKERCERAYGDKHLDFFRDTDELEDYLRARWP